MPNTPSSDGAPLPAEAEPDPGQGVLASLLERVRGWPVPVAVERTPRLCAVTLEEGCADLRQVRRLDDLGRALQGAWASESALETSDRTSAERAARAQAQLRESLAPRVEEARRARVRAEIRQHFDAWADPYARDTAGMEGILAMEATLGSFPLVEVQAALAEMRAAGQHHDALDQARQHAISRRMNARAQWDAAAVDLLSALPSTAQVALCARLPAEVSPGFDEDAWFDAPSEP